MQSSLFWFVEIREKVLGEWDPDPTRNGEWDPDPTGNGEQGEIPPEIQNRAQLFERWLALNLGLKLSQVFFFLCSKAFSQIIFSVIFRASNHQLKTLFKLSNLNSNLALTLGYLNPALNNSALYCISRPSQWWYVCPWPKFQIGSTRILKSRVCPCQYSTHPYVICHHFH